jgi:hypothetical protein
VTVLGEIQERCLPNNDVVFWSTYSAIWSRGLTLLACTKYLHDQATD